MKNKGLKNNFNQHELNFWFESNRECWVCGKSHWDCFHHIMGRGGFGDGCESSILNSAPLNNFQCHLAVHGELRQEENCKILLQKTMKYLLSKGYKFDEVDKKFIDKYKNLYDI